MSTNTSPNLSQPLINEPAQTSPTAAFGALGPLEQLVGTWTNQNIHGGSTGGTSSPFSYNLMPLPQTDLSSPEGYILKNFSYYEEITFSVIHGNAPNRGGLGTQVANTLFYEQRIYFADGPNKDALVHAENGSWLFLTDQKQVLGPYGNGNHPGLGNKTIPGSTAPSQQFNIVKQMSVPHGNSILAVGAYSQENNQQAGSPMISAASPVLPQGLDTDQYHTESVGNLNPAFTLNPNLPLKHALAVKPADSYLLLTVDSNNGDHSVTNIGFEQIQAKVTRYFASYWLESFNAPNSDILPLYTQLQYSQTILMDIPIKGKGIVSFPHITTNTLTKKN